MAEENEKLSQLAARLDELIRRQNTLSGDISDLKRQIASLEVKEPASAKAAAGHPASAKATAGAATSTTNTTITTITTPPAFAKASAGAVEKFIGENLINKIGIAITIIGVAIGTKYSIEHQLISPVTRIILGYLLGIGLIVLGIRLKKKYENYSAVLVSGAMAILYFITYSAYGFYELFPQAVAFILMLVFTVFTVIAALNYDRQVIAHIGLVGAYAVPFLLSENTGKMEIMFVYTAIINGGILTIAVKKYWKPLYYSSFMITWLVYLVWYLAKYQPVHDFPLALTFLTVFFAIFYAIFLVYKLIRKEKFDIGDVFLLLSNSFMFYGVGYNALSAQQGWSEFLGLFTLCNALIHFIVSMVIYRQKLADRNLFYLVAGLVLVFITIAIPVQLNGHWVTLLWTFEAALLYWIGRSRHETSYEILSYVLMALALISIMQDWVMIYQGYPGSEKQMTPFINISFLTGILFVACFGFMQYVSSHYKTTLGEFLPEIMKDSRFFIPAIGLVVLYFTIRFEIFVYFRNMIIETGEPGNLRADILRKFKSMSIIDYSFLYISAITMVNNKVIRNRYFSIVCFILGTLAIMVFLTQGLYVLSELRSNSGLRYNSLLFAALMLYSLAKTSIQPAFDFVLIIALLWISSSELINWLQIFKYPAPYKLLLSILCGLYAFILTGAGIWKHKKHLRISALVLFSVTLLKLFFYDMSHVSTLARTAGFLSLGLLLLFVSFLYNKYKDVIL